MLRPMEAAEPLRVAERQHPGQAQQRHQQGRHRALLRGRLGGITVPSAVVWGEADRIVDVDYGRAYAATLGAPFTLVEQAGHLPHVEQPAATLAAVTAAIDAATP